MPMANWQIIVDESTNLKFLIFQKKYQLAEATCKLFYSWKDKGLSIKFCQDGQCGREQAIGARAAKSKDWQLGWQVEYV